MANNITSFTNRGYRTSQNTDGYVIDFLAQYDLALDINGSDRKIYFFPPNVVAEHAHSGATILMAVEDSANAGTFLALSPYGAAAGGLLIQFEIDNQIVDAMMFPYTPPPTPNTFIGGIAAGTTNITTAIQLEAKLGLASGTVQVFSVVGSGIECYIGINYSIPMAAFENNTDIIYYNDQSLMCVNIGVRAFKGCTSLGSAVFAGAATIGNEGFANCTSLFILYITALTALNPEVLLNCTSLPTLNAPNVAVARQYSVAGCTNLTNAVLTNLAHLDDLIFDGTTSLSYLTLPSVSYFDVSALDGWGGSSAYTLTVPSAMSSDPVVLQQQGYGTNIILI
jgi:BspA type Leucine rich repeat region (6 copies)